MHSGCLVLSATMVSLGTTEPINMQLMGKFLSNQVIKDIPLPPVFCETFKPLLMKLYPQYWLPSKIVQASLLSIRPVHSGEHTGIKSFSFLCGVQWILGQKVITKS